MLRANLPWGFRVASSPSSGRGHMIRCLALARALSERVIFFLDAPELWEVEMSAGGHLFQNESTVDSATVMMTAFDIGEIGAFLFDGYDFSQPVVGQAVQRGFCAEILDFSRETCAHVTLAPFANVNIKGNENTLSGPTFVPLDMRFSACRERGINKSVSGRAKSLLIAFGAYDSANATGYVLESLRPMMLDQVIVVALGCRAPHLDAVRGIVGTMKNARLVVDEEDMPNLYQECDMAIGAGGISMLERMCLGLPSIIVTTANTQTDQVRFAEDIGAVIHIGQLASMNRETIRGTVLELAGDVVRRTDMRKKGMDFIDGKGAFRATERLSALRAEFEWMRSY